MSDSPNWQKWGVAVPACAFAGGSAYLGYLAGQPGMPHRDAVACLAGAVIAAIGAALVPILAAENFAERAGPEWRVMPSKKNSIMG